MSIGQTLRITAEVLPITATNRTVSWEPSNTNVCIVDSNGLAENRGCRAGFSSLRERLCLGRFGLSVLL